MALQRAVPRKLSPVPLFLLFLLPSVLPQGNWNENGPNMNNDPFKNGVAGFRDPFADFKAPEPHLDLNDQRPDMVSRESPNSYSDSPAYPMSRQFNEPAPQFSNSANQFGSGTQFNTPQQPQFSGIPDQSIPNMPNPNVQFPNFQEPNFNLPTQNMGGGNLMTGPGGFSGDGRTLQGGFGGAQQQPFAQQPMGPVGAGQFSVPGLQSNPLQQIAMGSNLDFSSQPQDAQPMGFHQAGPRPFFPSNGQSNFGQTNFQQQQPSQGFNQGFQSSNDNQFQAQNNLQTQDQAQNQNVQQSSEQGLNQNVQQSSDQGLNQNTQQNQEQVQNQNAQQTQEPMPDQNASQSQDQLQNQNTQTTDQNQNENTPVMIGSAKVVPIEHFRREDVQQPVQEVQQQTQDVQQVTDDNTESTTADAVITEPLRIPEGLKSRPAGCGFHGLETWQKSPCETCKCDKGVTECEKVKCVEKPDDSSCIPIFHFTTCCPTFQCANASRSDTVPNNEQPVKAGDSCNEAGKFVPTSMSAPCSACKCNEKLVIQCKPISCPPRPRDTACRERLPKNPTVCCPEFDCPRSQGVLNLTSVKPQSVALDTGDDVDDSDAAGESSGRNGFGNSGAVLTSDDALASTEVPILEEQTTTTEKVTKPKRTTTRRRTTTTTEEPDDTDADDTSATTTAAPRPRAAAVVNANVDASTFQTTTEQITTISDESVTDEATEATEATTTTPSTEAPTTSTTSTTTTTTTTTQTSSSSTTQRTEKPTTQSKAVPTAENPSSERGAIHDCQGGWKFPAGCDVSRDCLYVARWKQLPAEQSVRFKITTRDAEKWTGIGFSKNKHFDKVDMVVGWVDKNSKVVVQDRHGDAHHPEMDHIQTLANVRGSRNGNSSTIEFTRRQKSHDNQDIMIDDETCPHFIFPVHGGAYDAFSQKIQAQMDDPEVSDVGVCVTKCTEGSVGGSDVLMAKTSRPVTQSTTTRTTMTTTLADDGSDDDSDSVVTSAPSLKNAAAVSGDTGGSCSVEGTVLSLNPCQNCTCQAGAIQCQNIVCQDTFSQHLGCVPSFKVGVCCPEWQCPNQKVRTFPTTPTTHAAVPFGFGRAGQRSTLQAVIQTSSTAATTTARVISVAKNPDKLLVLSKKQFNGTSNEADANTGFDQVPDDRMGVVTPPPGWTDSTEADVSDDAVSSTTITVPTTQVDVCANHACGANASCVVLGGAIPSCICKSGFEGDATIACLRPNVKAATNFCSSVKCGLNARCYDMDGRPQCKCDSGFSGDPMISCDTEINGGFVQPAECQLRSEIGGCQNFGMRWQFDSRISGCRQFVYSGCAGNDNNFESRLQCEQRCMPQKRFYRDKVCDSDTDLDSPACARCECTEQGFLACTPVSCGAPPNKDCRAIPQVGQCCPKYDCTVISSGNASDSAGGMVNTKSDVCSGVICHEPAFKAGCIRVKLPGECCATIQCGTAAAAFNVSITNASAPVLNFTQMSLQNNSSSQLPGVPCSLDDKISSSNPCLTCQCLNGSTTCSQVMCPPISPEQRRRCRITQLANQCCLSVDCSVATRPPSTLATTSTEAVASNDDDSADTTTTQGASSSATFAATSSTETTTLSTTATSTTAAFTRATTTMRNIQSTAVAAKVSGKAGCSEASDGGVCRATITRWFYNPQSGKCETFVYSGCGGNKNRYLTEERCKSSCK